MQRQQSFYLFFMYSAIISILIFGIFYYFLGSYQLIIVAISAIFSFVVLSISSFFSKNLILHFRLSVIVVLLAVCLQTFFTGGIHSPSLVELIIPSLLAFFYRPVRDRYIFMGVSLLLIITFLPLTIMGITVNVVPESLSLAHDFVCGVFVFLVIVIFSVLFRTAIVAKNEKLGTSMKQLQETTQKLIQSEKMASLGMLSAGVAHEINNPLNFIRGGIEMLEDAKTDSSEKQQYILAIKEGLNRAATIVHSLGHFSRQSESMDEQCDIHSVLDNCVIMLQPKLKYKGNVVKVYDKLPAVILGNEGRLHQAFLNMVSNAEHAIDDDGTIKITTKVNQRKIAVEIEDDGIGISRENLNKISDPFFTTKPVGQGSGLGLAITYRIFEEHKGDIKVSSTPGKGTKFVISFQRV